MRDQPGVAQGWIQSFIGQKRTSEITLIPCSLSDTHNDQVVHLLIKKKLILQVKRKKALQFSKLWMWGTLKTDSNWTKGSQVDPVAWSLKSAHKRFSKVHSSLPICNPHCLCWCTPDSKGVGWPVGGLCTHLFGRNITQIQVAMPNQQTIWKLSKTPMQHVF
jgi:hypothetical protein